MEGKWIGWDPRPSIISGNENKKHDDVIKWKHIPRYWPFVWGIHRSPANSLHKGQWHGASMFYLICARISGWANNSEAGNLRSHRAHYDVIVMGIPIIHVIMACGSVHIYVIENIKEMPRSHSWSKFHALDKLNSYFSPLVFLILFSCWHARVHYYNT